jgi:hypothetical protein
MTKEIQKQEALARMAMLHLHQNVVREFEGEGKLNISEKNGMLFWMNDEQAKMIEEWERESGNLVYHIIHSFTEFGELYSLLYVSTHEEEWELDREDLKDCYTLAYVKNVSDNYCSEYGNIGVKPSFGGLVRVA